MKKSAFIWLALLPAIAGCATPNTPVEVTRFNRAAETGDVPRGPIGYSVRSSDETSSMAYENAVAARLDALGYSSADMTTAEYRAEVEIYSEERRTDSGTSIGIGGGSYGRNIGLGGGISLPLGGGIAAYTRLSVSIVRNADDVVIWEGRAVQQEGNRDPAITSARLADALFADFPGNNGETVSVK